MLTSKVSPSLEMKGEVHVRIQLDRRTRDERDHGKNGNARKWQGGCDSTIDSEAARGTDPADT